MTLDTLLVLVGLSAAVFAVLPRRRRLELSFGWDWYHWLLAVAVLVSVHVLVLHSTWVALGWLEPWTPGLPPEVIAYFIAAVGLVLLWFLLRRTHLTPRRVEKLRLLLEDLLAQERYAEILSMLSTHLQRLAAIAESKLSIQRLRKRLECWGRTEPTYEEMLSELAAKHFGRRQRTSKLGKWLTARGRSLSRLVLKGVPDYTTEAKRARTTLRDYLLSPDVLDEMCRNRPYDALPVLSLDEGFIEEFQREYFSRLLSNTSSVLFFEIAHNQNLELGCNHRFYIPETNRLLHYLLEDPRRAEQLQAWKPVGDWVIAKLDDLMLSSAPDPYNYPICDFQGYGKWRCPIFAAMRFFDIMVSAAMYEGIEWHMWLFYFRSFARRMVRNLDPHRAASKDISEWDTRYEYLLNEIVDMLGWWVLAAEDLDKKNPHSKPKTASLRPEGNNIPKSALFTLGDCLHSAILSEEIGPGVKRTLTHSALHLYFQLRESERLADYAHVLRLVLRTGSSTSATRHAGFCEQVLEHLASFDTISHKSEHVHELRRALSS